MSKSHTSHQGRIPFQPQSGTNQTVEAARQDGTADHKKAKNEAMIPPKPEADATGDDESPIPTTTTGADK
jgi:hypothetical protein